MRASAVKRFLLATTSQVYGHATLIVVGADVCRNRLYSSHRVAHGNTCLIQHYQVWHVIIKYPPLTLTKIGITAEALTKAKVTAQSPVPAANEGEPADNSMAESATISPSPTTNTRKPAAHCSLPILT